MVNLSLNELKLIAKIRGIKGYERMSEDKLLSALNALKSVKTIREIRKENRDEDKVFRDLNFLLEPQKAHYEPKKTARAFNNSYIQYKSMGDKDKNLSVEGDIDVMRPYLSDTINNHKVQGKWRIHSGNTITENVTQ